MQNSAPYFVYKYGFGKISNKSVNIGYKLETKKVQEIKLTIIRNFSMVLEERIPKVVAMFYEQV